MFKQRLAPTAEFFDRAAVPPEIAELLAEWPEINPGTAKLIRGDRREIGGAGPRGYFPAR